MVVVLDGMVHDISGGGADLPEVVYFDAVVCYDNWIVNEVYFVGLLFLLDVVVEFIELLWEISYLLDFF